MAKKSRRIPYEEYPQNTATGLRALGTEWLRYTRGCYLITHERSPWQDNGAWAQRPDILGLDKNRHTIEIEIKVSKADFLHDADKRHRKNLESNILMRYVSAPNQLYYLVPRKLVDIVIKYAPPFAGVLTISETKYDRVSGLPEVDLIRKAQRLHTSRLNLRDTVVMARDMSGSIASMVRDQVRHLVTKTRLLDELDEQEAAFLAYREKHEPKRKLQPRKATR